MSEPMSYLEIGPTRAATVEFFKLSHDCRKNHEAEVATVPSPPLGEATVAPTQTGCASGANGTDAEVAQTRDPAGQCADASPRGLRASAKVAEQYLRKGSKVYLEGSLQTRKWQDQCQDRYSTEVVLQGFNSVLTM